MENYLEILKDKSLVLILSYAPTGLGHLRVTQALYRGLPKDVSPILLGSQEKSLSTLHRITSIHPLARAFAEWMQRGLPEDLFTYFFKSYLRSKTKILHEQLLTILDQRLDKPKTVLMVATHFGLAHQLAEIKTQIEKERGVRVFLIVQVTDDSPQHMWYVDGADLIFVPSYYTKSELINYGKKAGLAPVNFEIQAYPVSPILASKLTKDRFRSRLAQLDPEQKNQLNIAIPVSGAAVGMHLFYHSIAKLSQLSDRYKFFIIVKSSKYTQKYICRLLSLKNVEVVMANEDREVVNKYESIYKEQTIALEVTKPSEQAFKALVDPSCVGGSILLFSEPIGRQEYDNLRFLRRHKLLPEVSEQQFLWQRAKSNTSLADNSGKEILAKATNWRGLEIPKGSTDIANFINWCLRQRIFLSIFKQRIHIDTNSRHHIELQGDGVTRFWKIVAAHIYNTQTNTLKTV